MKNLILVILLISTHYAAFAQKQPYRFPEQIDSIAKAEDDPQTGGTMYSRIGNYPKALDAYKSVWKFRRVGLRQGQRDSFPMYHAEEARHLILEQAKKYRVIIINEAHHIPRHRVFTESLLAGLREQGYDIFAMEAFDCDDSTIMKRGYPLITSGSYVVDPCYGNMMRTAIGLKYRLLGYEADFSAEARGDDKDPAYREIEEAKNIAKALKQNPQSKIIVHCGYDHLIKDTMPGSDSWRHAMAGWLKLMTGIDPLTIDQTILTETGEDTLDNPFRTLIHADHSVVMMDQGGVSLKPKTRYNADISVYHPDTKYIHGRPDWQISGDKKTENINKKIAVGFPCLALVYRAGEDYEKAVPTDVVEIQNREEDIHVILEKKRKNVIVLLNPKGEQQIIFE